MFDSWDTEWDGWNFLSFWAIFCPFTPSNNSENQNFEKIKKGPRDVIILHMCTKNHNHMMYASWDTECNRQNFLIAILGYYLPFYPINNPGTQILKNEITGNIILKMCTTNDNHMMYSSWDTRVHHKRQSYNVCFLRYVAQRTEFFVIWGHFLPYYLTNNPSNQNFEKMEKKNVEILLFYTCVP